MENLQGVDVTLRVNTLREKWGNVLSRKRMLMINPLFVIIHF